MIHNKYFEVMKEFLKGYNKEIYGRELVGKVSISQKNIALTLMDLEELGILVSKLKGNMRYYSLNRKNLLIEKYLLLLETEKCVEFLEKHQKIKVVLEDLDFSGIVCVFGSYAKGLEKKDSDLDLFVVGSFDEEMIKKAEKTFGIEINIHSGKMKDFVNSLKGRDLFVNEILENHVLLKGFESFIQEVLKQKW